jgi:hypothetical protein
MIREGINNRVRQRAQQMGTVQRNGVTESHKGTRER